MLFCLFSKFITFLLKIKFYKNGTYNGNWLFFVLQNSLQK